MKSEIAPKDQLFQTVARLFYRQGYRATGVDTIAAESGIAALADAVRSGDVDATMALLDGSRPDLRLPP